MLSPAVFEATFDEFQSIMSKQGTQDESVVRLRGLPWNATLLEIADFFKGMPFDYETSINH